MIKKFTDFVNEMYSNSDAYSGPSITTWSGDNTGALGSKKGSGGGKIGAEFDSNSDVSSKGPKPWKQKHIELKDEKGKKEKDKAKKKVVAKLDKVDKEKHIKNLKNLKADKKKHIKKLEDND